MATPRQVSDALVGAFEQSMLKYAGGKIRGKNTRFKQGKRVVPASSTIVNSHFTSGNSAFYAPLNPVYAARKFKSVGKKPILVFSGDMKKSIVGRAQTFYLGGGRYRMTFKQAVPYAKFHSDRHPTKLNKLDIKRFVAEIKKNLKSNLRALRK